MGRALVNKKGGTIKKMIQSAPRMRGVTPVPNGPLIKKKGLFKGSTLLAGGAVKKAQDGKSLGKGSYIISNNGRIGRTNGLYGPYESMDTTGYSKDKKKFILKSSLSGYKPTSTNISRKEVPSKIAELKKGATRVVDTRKKPKMANGGAMIKRADGSFSKPGLWDNIRKNKGSGKKPTKAMLVQEKKIKAKTKK